MRCGSLTCNTDSVKPLTSEWVAGVIGMQKTIQAACMDM